VSNEPAAAVLITELTKQLRQSFQTCSSHSIGPVTSFSRCVQLAREGRLSTADLRAIAQQVVDLSSAELRVHTVMRLDETELRFLKRRERQVVDFTSSLFSLTTLEKLVHTEPGT